MRKPFYLLCGWTSLALGVVGIAVPLLPTTPFVLLAALCFSRASTRLHRWLLNHRWFGATIRQWEETRTVRRATKVKASVAIAASFLVTVIWFAPALYWKIALGLLGAALAAFVVSLPEQAPQPQPARPRRNAVPNGDLTGDAP